MPGLEPLIHPDPAHTHTLILGSMPSLKSMAKKQYYAHPQNSFWPLVANIYGFDSDAVYADRVAALTITGVAVWDVLHDCHRPGSLDSNIDRSSERPNDFSSLFARLVNLRLIAFNGAASKQIFMRHCKSLLDEHKQLTTVQLPSTSPAHAAMNRQQKLHIWQRELSVA